MQFFLLKTNVERQYKWRFFKIKRRFITTQPRFKFKFRKKNKKQKRKPKAKFKKCSEIQIYEKTKVDRYQGMAIYQCPFFTFSYSKKSHAALGVYIFNLLYIYKNISFFIHTTCMLWFSTICPGFRN